MASFGLGCVTIILSLYRDRQYWYSTTALTLYKDGCERVSEMPDLVVVDAGGRRLSLWR